MKAYIRTFLFIVLCAICYVGVLGVVWYVDPFLHFRQNRSCISYRWGYEEYINDGLLRHYDYDNIIIGNSYVENTRPSAYDEKYGYKSVKIPLAGGTMSELAELTRSGLKYNPDVKQVVMCLDYSELLKEKDEKVHNESLGFLQKDDLVSNIKYLTNSFTLSMTITDLERTLMNVPTMTMDEFVYWGDKFEFGRFKYVREKENNVSQEELSDDEKQIVYDNIYENVIKTIKENPEVSFKLYFSPNSICYWDQYRTEGTLLKRLQAEEMLVSEALKYDNASVYCFTEDLNFITNLSNYKDIGHYTAEINDLLLDETEKDTYRLTKDNYKNHLEKQREQLLSFDYDTFLDGNEHIISGE